jgi:cell division protein FtsB
MRCTFRIFWPIVVLSVILFANGCSSEAIEALKQENAELRDEIKALETEYEQQVIKNGNLENDNKTLEEKADMRVREYEQLQKKLEQLEQAMDQRNQFTDYTFSQELDAEVALYQEEINKLLKVVEIEDYRIEAGYLLNMFNPMFIQEGNRLSGFEAVSVTKEENEVSRAYNYFIEFKGEFEVDGRIFINQVGSGYVFCTNAEDLFNAPHTYVDRINKNLCFTIKNIEDIEHAVGEELTNMKEEEPLALSAVFSNYKFNFVPETDVQDQATFVRLTGD